MWFLLFAGLGLWGLSKIHRARSTAIGRDPNPDHPQANIAVLRPDGYPNGRTAIYNGPWYFNRPPSYFVDMGPSSVWLFVDDGQAATREALQSVPHGMGVVTVDERLPGLLELGHGNGDKLYVLPASFQPPLT